VDLADFIPPGHHDDLERMRARWRRREINEAAIVPIIARHVRRQRLVDKGLPRFNRQEREARLLRERLVRTLKAVENLYGRPEYRRRPSPIRKHARALLAYVKLAERRRNLAPELRRNGKGSLGVAVVYGDPLVPPIQADRGPRGWLTSIAREQLAELGLSRRDVSWLRQYATER